MTTQMIFSQTPQLVPNQTGFAISVANYGNTNNHYCFGGDGYIGQDMFDGNTSSGSARWLNCRQFTNSPYSTSTITFETKRSIRLNSIVLKRDVENACFDNNYNYNGYILESAYSELGPWTIIGTTNGGGQCNFSMCDMSINLQVPKVSRYWRITIPPITCGSCTCVNGTLSVKVNEILMYETPQITTSNGSSVIVDNQCVTLTCNSPGENYLWSTGETTQSITVCNSGTYTCNLINTTFSGNQDNSASIIVSNLGSQDNLPSPNGEVYSIVRKNNKVYYGGDFDYVGPVTGSEALLDNLSGINVNNFPRIDSTVNCVIPDNSGGWYVGGSFSHIGNYFINNLVHIKSDNSVDLTFKPEPNNSVLTLVLNGSYLYVGGNFTQIQNFSNNYLAKLNVLDGSPLFWNANVNGVVNSIQLYNNDIIVGGSFSSLGGLPRTNLGSIDSTFLQASNWTPNPNSTVNKLYVNGNKLYVGGSFTNISGINKSRGAGYSLPNYTLDLYDFGANGTIKDFIVNNNLLYVAGEFTIIGGANRNYLAALNPLNAIASNFNASADGIVSSLAVSNNLLIAGGSFSNIGGQARNRIASLNLTTGNASNWNPNVMGIKGTTFNVNAVSNYGNNIYVGGLFYSVGGTTRNNLACLDLTSNQLSSWNPNINNIVRAISLDNNYVYIGGDFTTVNGTIIKNHIAQLNISDGLPTGWNPNCNGVVNSLAISGTLLFVGGTYTSIGGMARTNLSAINTLPGSATNFNPSPNGTVNSLIVDGDNLYAGGAFTTINGQTRNRIASFSISSGSIYSFDPNVDNIVNTLSLNNNKLYIGGTFTSVSGVSKINFAEYDIQNNSTTTLYSNLTTSTTINSVQSINDIVYLGGSFNYSNQWNPIINSCVVKTTDSSLMYWQPNPDDIVRTISASTDKIFIGGRFKNITLRYQPFFASLDPALSSQISPVITSLSSNTICIGSNLVINGTGFNNVTNVTIGSVSVPFIITSNTQLTISINSNLSGIVKVTNPIGSVLSSSNITVISTQLPTASQNQTVNQGSTLSNLIVNGSNLIWYSSNTSSTILQNNTLLVNGTTYYVSQTVNGCEGPRLAVTVQLALNTDNNMLLKLNYSPNPVDGKLNITSSDNIKIVSIYNILGVLISQNNFSGNNIQIDMSNFSSGNYFIKVESDEKMNVFKIIKK